MSQDIDALQAIVVELSELRGRVDELQADITARDAAHDVAIEALRAAVGGPAEPAGGEDDEAGYRPAPSPRWWELDSEAREREVSRVAEWVEHVYRPVYGHLAAGLGQCWKEHDLCLAVLDVLAELHTVLYLKSPRTVGYLSSQADWHARLLTPLADLLTSETKHCGHSIPVGNGEWASRIGARL